MRRWVAKHPLMMAVLLVLLCAGLGYVAAALASGQVRETLVIASTTLLFGALLGGLVKLFLEAVQRAREQRAERVRTLIAAHQSVRTYGNEMRNLIDSAVQLRNVVRALDQTSGVLENVDGAAQPPHNSPGSFLKPLDLATWILRSELTRLSTRQQLQLPSDQRETYKRLTKRVEQTGVPRA